MKTGFFAFLSAIALAVVLVVVQSAEAQSYLQAAACSISGNNTACIKTINVASGGTGAATFTAHGVMLGEGTGALVPTAVGSSSQVLVGSTGADPGWGSVPAAALPAISQSTAGVDASSGQRLGTNTNDTASAGNIGEQIASTRLRSAALSAPTTGTNYNVLSSPLVLTAGAWRVDAMECNAPSGNWTIMQMSISRTSATLSGTDTRAVEDNTGQIETQISIPSGTSTNDICLTTASYIAVSGNTNIYLVAVGTFTSGTNSVWGQLYANRVR